MQNPPKLDIKERFSERGQAERYRDRFRKRPRHRRTHEREADALRAVLARLADVTSAMDVGSGPGRFVPVFTDRKLRLVQADFSRHMLDISREEHPANAEPGAYVQADARKLPFGDGVVDLVFCHRLLNHLPDAEDRKEVLRQLGRVSKKYVVVSCLTPPGFVRAFRKLYEAVKGTASVDGHVGDEDLLADAHTLGMQLLTRIPIRSLLRSAAFLVFGK